ncbi:MAG: hypothetical protein EA423_09805 [Phycisphaerales bacterium]|nr:MAG: hypothetical protein EA423_09805 [Phycisphaerales bacterium]
MHTRLIPCAAVIAAVVLITGLAGGPSSASASDRGGSGASGWGVAPGALLLMGCACLVAAPRRETTADNRPDAAPMAEAA